MLITKWPIIYESNHVVVWKKKNISIMLRFNYQESHRGDILRICRYCSCMPSCRRILTSVLKTFWLSIMNVLLLTKQALCFDLIINRTTGLTFYESAGTAAACLPAEGYFCFKILLTEYNECTFGNLIWIYCQYWNLCQCIWSRIKCSCTCRTAFHLIQVQNHGTFKKIDAIFGMIPGL